MREILKVFRFELSQKLKQKSFYVTTIILALIAFLITVSPVIYDFLSSDNGKKSHEETVLEEETQNFENDSLSKLGIVINGEISNTLIPELEKVYRVVKYKNIDELKNAVESDEVEEGAAIKNDLEITLYKKTSNVFAGDNSQFEDLIKNNYKYNIMLKDYNISREDFEKIDNISPNISRESLGRNNIASYVISYIAIMFMYFMILVQGQLIATSVAREKDNRTMELLITTVKPKSLIWGKVLSGVVISLTTFLAILVAGILGFSITLMKNAQLLEILKAINFNLRIQDLVIFIVYLLLGVTLYYLIFAALGSLVSKLDELNQALTPITVIVVIAFMLPMMSLSTPNSTLMKVISFVPFTSPLAMFVRYQMTDVNTIELLISAGILMITVVLTSMLAANIYRAGTLNYGNKMKLFKALKNE